MELNLRKARMLESKIQNYLDDNRLEVKASVRTMGTVKEAQESINIARTETVKSLKEREDLLDLRYSIRRMIEQQNETSGINSLLNEKVFTDRVLKELANVEPTPAFSTNELEDQILANMKILNKGDSPSSDRFGRHIETEVKTSFTVPVLTKEELDVLENSKLKHKRRLEEIDDKLSLENMTRKVTLEEGQTKLLESHRLL